MYSMVTCKVSVAVMAVAVDPHGQSDGHGHDHIVVWPWFHGPATSPSSYSTSVGVGSLWGRKVRRYLSLFPPALCLARWAQNASSVWEKQNIISNYKMAAPTRLSSPLLIWLPSRHQEWVRVTLTQHYPKGSHPIRRCRWVDFLSFYHPRWGDYF